MPAERPILPMAIGIWALQRTAPGRTETLQIGGPPAIEWPSTRSASRLLDGRAGHRMAAATVEPCPRRSGRRDSSGLDRRRDTWRVTPENVEIVRDQYAATNLRDFRRAMSHYADDVVMVIPAGIRAGTFEGREAVGEWFGDWFATFDRDAQFEIEEIIDLDDASVLLVAKHHATGRASGVEVEQRGRLGLPAESGKDQPP